MAIESTHLMDSRICRCISQFQAPSRPSAGCAPPRDLRAPDPLTSLQMPCATRPLHAIQTNMNMLMLVLFLFVLLSDAHADFNFGVDPNMLARPLAVNLLDDNRLGARPQSHDVAVTQLRDDSLRHVSAASLDAPSHAEIPSISTNTSDTQRFIIMLNPSAAMSDLETHITWVLHTLNISVSDTLSHFNLTLKNTSTPIIDTITSLLSSPSPTVRTLTTQTLGGIFSMFTHAIVGYVASFDPHIIDLIQSNPIINVVEKDTPISISQNTTSVPMSNNTTSVKTDTVTISGIVTNGIMVKSNQVDTTIQVNPPSWGLDRITHRESGFEGRFVYPDNVGENVTIYVLDTGVQTDHPDFGGRASFGTTFSSDGAMDGNGHGTHVAGIAASTTYGVAKQANIVAVKVLDNDGSGMLSNVISGLDWVAHDVMKTGSRSVINLSLGRGGKSNAMNSAIASVVGQGIVVSVAAGNDNTDACANSPQDSPVVLTVGSSDADDMRSSFSNYGSCVGIYAPGSNITSLWNNGGVQMMSGTSQAAPHLSGVMAIVLSLYPNITSAQVIQAIKSMATTNAVSSLTPSDTNLLLYNGMDTQPLWNNNNDVTSNGSNFGLHGGGWILVRQILLTISL